MGTSLLADEPPYLTSMEKWRIFSAWNGFISSGFEFKEFSVELYQFLVQHCGFVKGYQNQALFWTHYFDGDIDALRLFLHQFGTGVSAETGTTTWLGPPNQDLKELMRQRSGLVYTALLQMLDDVEYRHQEMVQAWASFASQNGLALTNITAPRYRVSANTRDLLAFTGRIALLYSQRQPEPQPDPFPVYHQQLVSPLIQPVIPLSNSAIIMR
jgi:hypothetical protein